jgi:hypothetical protein
MAPAKVRQLRPPPPPPVTLFIRGVDGEVAKRVKLAARARGITLGEYLGRLIDLHDRMRSRADDGDRGLQAELEALRLQSVST